MNANDLEGVCISPRATIFPQGSPLLPYSAYYYFFYHHHQGPNSFDLKMLEK